MKVRTEMLPLWSPVLTPVSFEQLLCKNVRPTRKTKLLLQRAQNETEGLRPNKVDEVSESTQAPDVPLISAEAVVVDLAVDQNTLLLVQRQALELLARDTRQAAFMAVVAVVVLRRGRRARVRVLVALFKGRETHGVRMGGCVGRLLCFVSRMMGGERMVSCGVWREEEKQPARQR